MKSKLYESKNGLKETPKNKKVTCRLINNNGSDGVRAKTGPRDSRMGVVPDNGASSLLAYRRE